MAKLDPQEKIRRALARKAITDEKNRIKREGVERRKAESAARREAKEAEVLQRRADKVATRLAKAEKEEADKIRKLYIKKMEYQEHLDIIYNMCLAANRPGLSDFGRKKAGRCVGTLLFELPFKFIGWKSEAYIIATAIKRETEGKGLPPTHEHIYPRQFDGEFLICHMEVMGYMSKATFEEYVNVFCQTAHVTRQENEDLGRYQKAHKFIAPEIAYDAAEVKVVYFDSGRRFHRLEEVAPQKVLHAYFGRRTHIKDK